MKSHLYPILKFVVGLPLTLIAFFFITKIIFDQAPALLPHITNLNPVLLLYGILCFLLFYFLRSFVWHRILNGYGYKIPFKDSCYLWSVSELKRYIPGNIWSFLGRAVMFDKKGVDKKDIAAGLIIEAELFVLGCLVVSLLSLPYFLPHFSSVIGWVGVTVAGLIIVVYVYNRQVAQYLPHKLRSTIHFLFPSFVPAENLLLIGISVVALLFFGVGNYFVMTAAFGTNPQLFPPLVGVFVLAFVAGYLSLLTPAGFGVREGIVMYALLRITSSGLAAFTALFTRIILIISEIIFIFLSYIWFKSRSVFVTNVEKWLKGHVYESIVFGLSAIYTIYIATISILRYDNYYTGRFDLGNMAQTVWNTLHGNIFMITNPNGTESISRLAFHADFILVLLAPFYALWQDPRNLLLIQTIVIAAGAFFVYYIAQVVLKNKNLSLVFAFAYLINPSIERANLYDFHPVTLATTFLLATFYFYLKKKYALFLVFALLSAICKEQIWLIIGLFGFLLFFHHKKHLLGTGVFFVSIGIFYFLFWHAIPQTLGSQHFALEYLSEYGQSPTQVIKSILLSPDLLLQTIMEKHRSHFLTQLFSPLGYLSLFFPFFLIFAAPDLLINLLSNNAQLHQIYYQYTATITPFIFLSAIYGVWVIKKALLTLSFPRTRESSVSGFRIKSAVTINIFFIVYIIIFSLHSAYLYGPLPGSKEPNIDMITKPLPQRDYINSVLEQIPVHYKISASNNLGSHLSQREHIYVTPLGIDKADMILIHGSDPQAKETLKKVDKDPRFIKVVEKEGFVVFERK